MIQNMFILKNKGLFTHTLECFRNKRNWLIIQTMIKWDGIRSKAEHSIPNAILIQGKTERPN